MIEQQKDVRYLQIQKIVGNIEKQPAKDKRAQDLIVKWYEQGSQLTSEQKDKIGHLWMTKILGVSGQKAEDFVNGEQAAFKEVGLHHAGVSTDERSVEDFWTNVNEVCADFLTEEELKFLIEEDIDASGAWHMILALDTVSMIYLETFSDTLRALVNNAHVYK